MHDGRRSSRSHASRFTAQELHFDSQHSVHECRYRHVLVPTGLNNDDRAGLLLGFELASLHQAKLTLLHVLPRPRQERITHELDAIHLLHSAAKELRGPSAGVMPVQRARLKLHKFAEGVVPQRLLDEVQWQGECCVGDVAPTIACHANETAADLVILSTKPLPWWLPFEPRAVRTIERRTQANVMLIRKQPSTRSAIEPRSTTAFLICGLGE